MKPLPDKFVYDYENNLDAYVFQDAINKIIDHLGELYKISADINAWLDRNPGAIDDKKYTIAQLREKVREWDTKYPQIHGSGAPTITELLFLDWLENQER